MTQSETRLLPCPFCGGEGQKISGSPCSATRGTIKCRKCKASAQIVVWNTRKGTDLVTYAKKTASEQHLKTMLLSDEMVEVVAIAQSQWVNGINCDEPRFHRLVPRLQAEYRAQAKAALQAVVEGMI